MSEDTENTEMSFLNHLEEMRWRLVKATAVVMVVAIIIFVNTTFILDHVFMTMKSPSFPTYRFFCWVSQVLGLEDGLCMNEIPINLQSITTTGQFTTNMYFAFIGGFIISFPFVFYQFWAFLKPALKSAEVKVAKGSVFYGSLLFSIGILFGYFVISPLSVQFFGSYTMSDELSNNFTITSYLSMITTTTLFSGLFFELPMIIMILAKLDIVSATLLRKYRKHALVGILILAAVITPPDIISQVLVAIPVLILYEIGILVAKRIKNSRKK